jgi:nucleotide-binding universal stress UspA family protein
VLKVLRAAKRGTPAFAAWEYTAGTRRGDANALLVIQRHRSLASHMVLGCTTRFVIAYGSSDVLIV